MLADETVVSRVAETTLLRIISPIGISLTRRSADKLVTTVNFVGHHVGVTHPNRIMAMLKTDNAHSSPPEGMNDGAKHGVARRTPEYDFRYG